MTAQLKGKRALVTGGNKALYLQFFKVKLVKDLKELWKHDRSIKPKLQARNYSPQMWFHDRQETSY